METKRLPDEFRYDEKLYRAVFPPSHPSMMIKRDGTVSSAAFADPEGLSVERGYYRTDETVIEKMRRVFRGCIVSVKVGDCRNTDAVVRYLPTENIYHSEIHSSASVKLLTKSQRKQLAEKCVVEYMTD